jgi:hypothetical protein
MDDFFFIVFPLLGAAFIIAVVILALWKKYSIPKLLCGLMVLWALVSIPCTALLYLFFRDLKSGFILSLSFGVMAAWGIVFCSLTIIERVGTKGAKELSSDIIKNGELFWLLRLFQAWGALLLGGALGLIYRWAKKKPA